MQYMALIYSDPALGPRHGTPEFATMMQGYTAFTTMLREAGAFVSGDALQGVDTATSVSVTGGKVETMDGPFAETKEHLGGYYIFQAPDLDTAIRYAAMIPTASYGTVELRPLVVW